MRDQPDLPLHTGLQLLRTQSKQLVIGCVCSQAGQHSHPEPIPEACHAMPQPASSPHVEGLGALSSSMSGSLPSAAGSAPSAAGSLPRPAGSSVPRSAGSERRAVGRRDSSEGSSLPRSSGSEPGSRGSQGFLPGLPTVYSTAGRISKTLSGSVVGTAQLLRRSSTSDKEQNEGAL